MKERVASCRKGARLGRGIIIWIRFIRRGGIILSHGGRVIGYWSL